MHDPRGSKVSHKRQLEKKKGNILEAERILRGISGGF